MKTRLLSYKEVKAIPGGEGNVPYLLSCALIDDDGNQLYTVDSALELPFVTVKELVAKILKENHLDESADAELKKN